MSIFLEIAIAVFLCAAVFAVITAVTRATAYPRRCGERVAAVVCAGKTAGSLEHTVRSLIRARDVYGFKLEIVLLSDEAEDDGGKMARILARDYDGVHILSKAELGDFLTELERI